MNTNSFLFSHRKWVKDHVNRVKWWILLKHMVLFMLSAIFSSDNACSLCSSCAVRYDILIGLALSQQWRHLTSWKINISNFNQHVFCLPVGDIRVVVSSKVLKFPPPSPFSSYVFIVFGQDLTDTFGLRFGAPMYKIIWFGV